MNTRRRGVTAVEVVIACALLGIFFSGVFYLLQRELRGLRSAASSVLVETQLQELVARLEEDLSVSGLGSGTTWLTADVAAAEGATVEVNQTFGLPHRGRLLLGRGTPDEERLDYAGLDAGGTRFLDLTRGLACTAGTFHAENEEALWAARAETLGDDAAPFPDLWDGRITTWGGPRVFRGDGTGLSFQRPVDPAGLGTWFDDDQVRWGADVAGLDPTEAWQAIVFEPQRLVSESDLSLDVNEDGDEDDVFELGSLELLAWNASNPAASPLEATLCPPFLLQERCAHGADLDADGFDDPLFVWDAERRTLHVTLFALIEGQDGVPGVRSARTTLFLRNSLEALLGPS